MNYHPTNELKNTEYNIYNRGTYSDWSEIISEDAKSASLLENLNSKEIIGHTCLENGIYKTDYEGGMFTIVNYTDSEYLYDGITVSAEDFIFSGGDVT